VDPDLLQALEPVLADLRASGQPLPAIAPEADPRVPALGHPLFGGPTAMLLSPDGTSMSVTMQPGISATSCIVMVADRVQEWLIEELGFRGIPTNWPRCPMHPDTHPLQPELVHEAAMWICPKTGEPIVSIGRLAESH
jgi:hypothetical protein